MNPAVPSDLVGEVIESDAKQARAAISLAIEAELGWGTKPVSERSALLRRIADLYEENTGEFLAIACREVGKNLSDGVAEIREAVDFLRYYADRAPKAERSTDPRGVIVCISPWNFPLVIFTGQIAAALVTGNTVIAKPAEQTPLITVRATTLMHEAGIPEDAVELLQGEGPFVGAALVADFRIGGVCFTGSTEVAKMIDRQLAKSSPGAMLIAETGGLNAMIVDSTALMKQAVGDIIRSAFHSAGQRCSALRILYVQEEVEEECLEMLFGAMNGCAATGRPLSTVDRCGISDQCRCGKAHMCLY